MTLLSEHPHRRLNPLTGEWVLISPHRTKRPWQGQIEKSPPDYLPEYDPECYLCPGNERANGEHNPDYKNTFVFTNDFATLLPDTPFFEKDSHSLLRAKSVVGTSRVICFLPRHDLTLPEMAVADIRQVVDVWAEQAADLGKQYRWPQIFQNKGAMMGSSNPHPHGQVWAGDWLPNEPTKEDKQMRSYFSETGHHLLIDYVELEEAQQERIVVANDHWVVVVPYWAVWPFETILMPRRHILRLPDLTESERDALADILKRLLIKYDNIFEIAFPYSMGWHGAPFDDRDNTHWQLHAHFYPPLLRSATVKKFLVGYEMMAEAQRDITAEQAAERLRELPEIHYKQRES
jgi:UDPglucose--hexose-1-phosphate uridylyltransferase